jgi:hypothetical protein
MAMDGKTKTATDNERTLIYQEETPQDPWHHWEGQSPYSNVAFLMCSDPFWKFFISNLLSHTASHYLSTID